MHTYVQYGFIGCFFRLAGELLLTVSGNDCRTWQVLSLLN